MTRGGIGTHVHAAASALASVADVTVVTSSLSEAPYREMVAANDPEIPAGVRFVFVTEPTMDEVGSFYSIQHIYSTRVYRKLRELYPDGGPDLIEFPDYLGEAFVTTQARRTLDPMLRDTRICVRLHTTVEIARVLNGFVDDYHLGTQGLFEGERYALANADHIVWPGGDVLDTYRRFYGTRWIADATVRIPAAAGSIAVPGAHAGAPPMDGPTRFLYVGRLERRKGVENLLRAATGLDRDDWTLTLVGGDSDTAPLGGSMREQLEAMAAGDPRIEFIDGLPRRELGALYASHHVLLCPSLWECWPNVVLEALEAGRPAMATRTGGLVEMLSDPGAGWLVGRDPLALAEAMEERLDDRARIDDLIAAGEPMRVFGDLADEASLRKKYLELARTEMADGGRSRPATSPLVSVIVPYFRLHELVEDTLESIFAQDYRQLEVIVVNDGSLWPEDAGLSELADRYPIRVLTQANSGLGAARNAGIRQSCGRYVLPLDADNMITPDFVRRCVDVLETDPAVAYVATWSQYIDEDGNAHEGADAGYRPIGNSAAMVMHDNVAGDAAALIRRRVFDLGHWYSTDLTSFEDWQLYRELHEAGLYGRVIPEPLLLYRVRADSMLREAGFRRTNRLRGEMSAHLIESRMSWEQSGS